MKEASMDRLLHTPEGVRDIYDEECRKKNVLSDKLTRTLNLYGYEDIQTPAFEYFEIFASERGTISSRNMYKMIDRDGSTLVLRPDITPSIARVVAKYFKEERIPLRFSYCGNVFVNNSGLMGKMKETTQIGAELVMEPGLEGDAEMIALAINCLLESGLTDFQIDIGHVGYFSALTEELGLSENQISDLKELIESKNYFAVEDFIDRLGKDSDACLALKQLPMLFGHEDSVARAREMTSCQKALNVLDYLEALKEMVGLYGYSDYVTIDLGMLSEYDYYTGIIFRGYTYGTGDPIVRGGRYDHLIAQFGKDAASVGFAIVLDELLLALSRQKIVVPDTVSSTMVLYESALLEEAIRTAGSLRTINRAVSLMKYDPSFTLADYKEYCRRHHIDSILHILDHDTLEKIDIADGSSKVMPIPAF